MKKYALINGKILDGSENMTARDAVVLVDDGKISDVLPKDAQIPNGCKIIDLGGKYLMPGLINMHVHLAGNGKPRKKQRDNAKLVKKIMSTAVTRAIARKLVAKFAKLELLSGVTTIRTVGGLADFDTKTPRRYQKRQKNRSAHTCRQSRNFRSGRTHGGFCRDRRRFDRRSVADS